MSKWFEPELNNNFDFIFSRTEDEEKLWFKAVIYADECNFKYYLRGNSIDNVYYIKTLKPNYKHDIIGKIYILEEFDEDSYWQDNPEYETEWSSYNQIIEFNTNEHGDIDLENIEFHDY